MRSNLPSKLILLIVLILNIFTGCKKAHIDPCEGLLNESPPAKIIVKFIDKQTREPLILDTASIKITDKRSGTAYQNWSVLNATGFNALNGSLTIGFFNETPGEYQFNIQLGNKGTALLSYQVSRKETDNPCRPDSYPIGEIKIVNQSFELFQYESRTYPNILVTAL
jgi:hypothetical protein